MKNWDSIARRYVEHDVSATETFGPLVEPVNDNRLPDGCCGYTADDGKCCSPPLTDEQAAGLIARASTAERKGDWLQTFSGRQFWPMDPRASEVFIEDIAHSLAMQTRYAGHCLRFYSVAEHSVLLTRYFRRQGASVEVQLWALLHDASEAYLVDVPRPVKPFLAGYKAAEAQVMRAVCERFGLPEDMPAEVHAADGDIIGNERANMAPCVAEWYATGPGLDGVYLRNWAPHVAELEFTMEYRRLMDERHDAGNVPIDPFELAADRAASRADAAYQFSKEQEAA